MGTAIIDIPKGVCPPPSEIGTLGAFFQPSTTSEKKLVRSDERLIRELVGVLDRQLIAAVDARSVSEFSSVRKNVMPRYVRALRALHDTVINLVSDEMLKSLSDSIIAELADDLEKQRESRFGDKLTDQALFTLWTIRKISSLAQEIISAGKVLGGKRQADNTLLYEYHANSLWAQFHLDVLFAAMKFDRPICEQIRETICDGLRASVNAYAIMKDALSLRRPQIEETAPALALPWDEEDEQLLASSMRDLNADPSVDC
ncbi:MAG: hypothetical protein ACYDCM_14075 [Candidatus Acidiferrales bacterium]